MQSESITTLVSVGSAEVMAKNAVESKVKELEGLSPEQRREYLNRELEKLDTEQQKKEEEARKNAELLPLKQKINALNAEIAIKQDDIHVIEQRILSEPFFLFDTFYKQPYQPQQETTAEKVIEWHGLLSSGKGLLVGYSKLFTVVWFESVGVGLAFNRFEQKLIPVKSYRDCVEFCSQYGLQPIGEPMTAKNYRFDFVLEFSEFGRAKAFLDGCLSEIETLTSALSELERESACVALEIEKKQKKGADNE